MPRLEAELTLLIFYVPQVDVLSEDSIKSKEAKEVKLIIVCPLASRLFCV